MLLNVDSSVSHQSLKCGEWLRMTLEARLLAAQNYERMIMTERQFRFISRGIMLKR